MFAEQVDGDDGERAVDDGARQVALRILDLAAGERQVGEAVVGPQHGNQREAEQPGLDRAGRRRGGDQARAAATAEQRSDTTTSNASAPNLVIVERPANSAPS